MLGQLEARQTLFMHVFPVSSLNIHSTDTYLVGDLDLGPFSILFTPMLARTQATSMDLINVVSLDIPRCDNLSSRNVCTFTHVYRAMS
jgi:hypothetical protein